MLRALLVILLLAALTGCALFATAPDPCPLPPELHPEAWTAIPLLDANGTVVMITYACRPKT